MLLQAQHGPDSLLFQKCPTSPPRTLGVDARDGHCKSKQKMFLNLATWALAEGETEAGVI